MTEPSEPRSDKDQTGRENAADSGSGEGQTLDRGKGFLEERPGHKSAMRALSFIALLAAIGFGAVTLTQADAGVEGIYLSFRFLLAAFAPKALQKFAEEAVAA